MGVQCKQEGAEHTALRGSGVVMVVQGTYPETYWFICRLMFKNGPGKLNISKEKASCWELLVLAYSAQTGGDDFFFLGAIFSCTLTHIWCSSEHFWQQNGVCGILQKQQLQRVTETYHREKLCGSLMCFKSSMAQRDKMYQALADDTC